MKTYSIPNELSTKYKGSGPALAALTSGTIVDLVYIRDLIPSFVDTVDAVPAVIDDHRVGGAALKLQKSAELVMVGMVSAWEFSEL